MCILQVGYWIHRQHGHRHTIISILYFPYLISDHVPCCWNWHALPQPLWLTMKRWGGRWPRRSAGKTGTPQPAAAAAESSGRDARLRVKCGRIAGKVVRWKGDLEKMPRRFRRILGIGMELKGTNEEEIPQRKHMLLWRWQFGMRSDEGDTLKSKTQDCQGFPSRCRWQVGQILEYN